MQIPVYTDSSRYNHAVSVTIKERRLFDVVHGLLEDEAEKLQYSNQQNLLELVLTSFRRVIRWRELYKCCAKCSLKPFLTCLPRASPIVVLSVLETLELMFLPCPEFETDKKVADRSERANHM